MSAFMSASVSALSGCRRARATSGLPRAARPLKRAGRCSVDVWTIGAS